MARNIAVLIALWSLAAAGALAQSPQPLTGNWLWEAEGKALLLLTLSLDETGQLTGTMQRPAAMQLQPAGVGIGVSGIKGPLQTVAVREVRRTDTGRVLAYAAPDGSTRESLVRADGHGGLLLVFFADDPAGMAAALRGVPQALPINLDWDVDKTYFLRDPPAAPNAELVEVFLADQVDRRNTRKAPLDRIEVRDAARRARVRQMLEQGLLRAADDYYRAALIFQQGGKPADYLLAHVLAMAAMTLGRADAAWIASTTLDRYLWSQDEEQVMGTQYASEGKALTQGAYNKALIPDSLRRVLGVPSRADQETQRQQMNRSLQSPGTQRTP